jgi:hypothetical protein
MTPLTAGDKQHKVFVAAIPSKSMNGFKALNYKPAILNELKFTFFNADIATIIRSNQHTGLFFLFFQKKK